MINRSGTERLSCPVWCNAEHSSPGDSSPYTGGYFHDSHADQLQPVLDPEPVFVSVCRYVTPDGSNAPDTVDLHVTGDRGSRVLTPPEARQLADLLYSAADIAATA